MAPKRVMRSKGPTPQRATPQRESESNSEGNIPSKAFKVLQQTINQSPGQSGRQILHNLWALFYFAFFCMGELSMLLKTCHLEYASLKRCGFQNGKNPPNPYHTPAFIHKIATNSKLIPSKYVHNTFIYTMHLCQNKMLSEFFGLPPPNFRFK